MWKAFLLVAMMGLGACTGMAVRSGRPSEPIPGPMTGRIPGTIDSDGETGPMNSTLPSSSGRQTLCRSTPYPRGWVAVDYVEGGSTCGSSAREPYAAVVLQRLAPLPQGTVLTICSGQTVPINWQREAEQEGVVSTGQCPRNPGDTRTGPTIMQIRRIS
jgi:hypothetical protein